MTDSRTETLPPPPTKRTLTTEELRARGFIVPSSSGEGFGLPLSPPPTKVSD